MYKPAIPTKVDNKRKAEYNKFFCHATAIAENSVKDEKKATAIIYWSVCSGSLGKVFGGILGAGIFGLNTGLGVGV